MELAGAKGLDAQAGVRSCLRVSQNKMQITVGTTTTNKSLVAQSYERIDLHRPARRNITSEKRDSRESNRYRHVG